MSTMPAPWPPAPLTHHEILAIAAPFARAGRRIDLARSDRADRRLVFCAEGPPELTGSDPPETLELHSPRPGRYTLVRVLDHADGLQSRLEIEGPEPDALLDALAGLPPRCQFESDPETGVRVAKCLHLTAPRLRRRRGGASEPRLILQRAEARLRSGLTLHMRVPTPSNLAAEVKLAVPRRGDMQLPDDLLQVLGEGWARLAPTRDGWRCSVRLQGRDAERGRDAAQKMQCAAAHVARTLAEPPHRFHEQRAAQRWGIALQRALPLLVLAGLLGIALLATRSTHGMLNELVLYAPPCLLLSLLAIREPPLLRMPYMPNRSNAGRW